MAGFKTHISTSTMVGVAYGYWGVTSQGMSLESGLLAGGLCSVAGMLPDLDSTTGVPLRETSLFIASIAPMLMIDRFRDMGLTHESMALAAMLVYILIRFVAVEFFRRYTVHRGMWHSIPAGLIAGLGAYLIMPCPSEAIRIYKSLAVFIGFLTHLILDEIWSLDFSRGRLRVKRSFGTALKFFSKDWWANVSVWGKLGLLCYLAWSDHGVVDRLRQRVRLDRERYTIPDPAWVPSAPSLMRPDPAYPQPGYPQPSYPQPGYPQPGYPNSQPPYPAPQQPAPGYGPRDYWQAQPANAPRVAAPPYRPALPQSGDPGSF